jgi:hypothetical protein
MSTNAEHKQQVKAMSAVLAQHRPRTVESRLNEQGFVPNLG